ncbi:transcription-repair coupling factor [Hyphococcus sp. DH-69]|uniref:transcription-repair coupling factor n=1 Tax=Hyphococcus formosus TaxID=3143534 RepID=UPI00398BAAA6
MAEPSKTMTSGVALINAEAAWRTEGRLDVFGAPEGADALVIAEAARKSKGLVLHIARDGARAATMVQSLKFFAPDIPVIEYPAWDCLPYDRVSPSPSTASRRMASLAAISTRAEGAFIVVASVNAAVQKTPPKEIIANAALSLAPGALMPLDKLTQYLSTNGYARSSTVREPGEYAVRGGLVDIFPPGADEPVRLDFFGDSLESIRAFDAETQRTTKQLSGFSLAAASEVLLSDETISRFRKGFIAAFGPAGDDPLYEAISAGRTHAGAEHWLPLFYERMDSLFDFIGDSLVFMDHLAEEAVDERLASITDHYDARAEDAKTTKPRNSDFAAPVYRPLEPSALYLSDDEWKGWMFNVNLRPLSPFAPPENTRGYNFGAKLGRSFAAERAAETINVFDAVSDHAKSLMTGGKKVIISCWSDGSADRMRTVLSDHGAVSSPNDIPHAENWSAVNKSKTNFMTAVLGLEAGFETPDAAFISEQDILGDRLVRRGRKKRAENFLSEASSLNLGDLVVHVEHGIGRYQGLQTLEVQGAPHDCLHLEYASGKLFLPVENIELLSRFGSDDAGVQLDKLGGAAWQGRKAKMRERIKMLAEQLIAIAAKRTMRHAEVVTPATGTYDEFCARFPYAETEDQENAIADVIEDFAKGQPMDRLVCGDVGFGKTEVALRAAFVMAMTGRQVAVIAPTTLLARQHYRNFAERFKGFPVNVAQLSRMVSASDAKAAKEGLADGRVDIIVGTHALLQKTIKFRDIGLVIVDEEQHFGVKHKERLKEFRADTHVLTLSATPIPRTLQLAMSGIRDLSLIATPPVDRLAVRTTVGPFDAVVARETLLREHYRGGQSFYVAPRIKDLDDITEFLSTQLPELKYKVAHGQMGAGELEDIMTAFYEGKFDVLVSTTIIESGLDIPTANTILIHRADMFGLGQLYQLRGRVGRSKQRAYAYITTPARGKLTPAAERRLKVMQSLDTLGAGFTLASHDLDIRGAGNLLGEEQSGHVKEVGVELYQHMLEEAVAELREGGSVGEEAWSPQINLGTSVLIPETYVTDLDVRMALYRRLGDMTTQDEIDGFGAELVDRFGPMPREVDQLLEIVAIKGICRRAGIAKIDAGPKGAVISFRNDQFANVAGLIEFVSTSPLDVKLRPDQKFVFRQEWADDKARLRGARKIAGMIAEIAEKA